MVDLSAGVMVLSEVSTAGLSEEVEVTEWGAVAVCSDVGVAEVASVMAGRLMELADVDDWSVEAAVPEEEVMAD